MSQAVDITIIFMSYDLPPGIVCSVDYVQKRDIIYLILEWIEVSNSNERGIKLYQNKVEHLLVNSILNALLITFKH